ncbi:hypothetical protein BJ085DRAFT_35392 [Dimargaris cristalligena]|uniref:Uncharacterized protein n=1 Tax=Dimargaris cristalligena TaxID=215637 RepID=A0A4P9ZMG8_9FUNG|nr:hypothetical protein BJ085DRAFT_35392 [Dimargaris cristalligena]|eukprot:RKP33480.1 hypothetical protein BJ085DRAFT_35392 [Dimargaris cristalligena]
MFLISAPLASISTNPPLSSPPTLTMNCLSLTKFLLIAVIGISTTAQADPAAFPQPTPYLERRRVALDSPSPVYEHPPGSIRIIAPASNPPRPLRTPTVD